MFLQLILTVIFLFIPGVYAADRYDLIKLCMKSTNYIECKRRFDSNRSYPKTIHNDKNKVYGESPIPIKIIPYRKEN